MRPINKFKRLLPPSSRSFHTFEDNSYQRMDNLEAQIHDLQTQTHDLEAQAQRLVNQNERLISLVEDLQKTSQQEHAYEQDRDMMLYWQMFRRDGESLEAAQLRFFRGLPKETGIHKLFQDAEAALFSQFDVLCRQHDILYWGSGGTILGAYRHQDFIPWDDDIDVYITRDQLQKLEQVVREDGRFRVTVLWDWYVPCKQIRFRSADEDNPCFVDLFTLDWAKGDPQQVWDAGVEQRKSFVSEIRTHFGDTNWPQTPYLPSSDPLAPKLEATLDAQLDNLKATCDILPNQTGATCLVEGPENIDDTNPSGPYPIEEWLPVEHLRFRDLEVPVPAGWKTYLSKLYGDYMAIPKDINSHEHVADDYIESSQSVAAMHRLIDEAEK
ncbi:LicD family protein [Bifidobacterium sp. ESL0682]|uniref:LicD family protein n=1 Tax=Bifidobacterium sp. ESL0682 TaxID=2983212 RepID=UPI0023F6D785|nr:LicD family protein [Bifidobacterium sp. ESL0682]WEV41851.1 LicD family protein [Bifidobacterium sp. ESL0682]